MPELEDDERWPLSESAAAEPPIGPVPADLFPGFYFSEVDHYGAPDATGGWTPTTRFTDGGEDDTGTGETAGSVLYVLAGPEEISSFRVTAGWQGTLVTKGVFSWELGIYVPLGSSTGILGDHPTFTYETLVITLSEPKVDPVAIKLRLQASVGAVVVSDIEING